MKRVTKRMMYADRRSPLIVQPIASGCNLAEVVQEDAATIADELAEHGALLFRSFAVREIADFDAFIGAVTRDRMDYVYGSTPRTAIGNRIFTATEYPPVQEIPLHNENSYQREWPLKIALCCLTPATSGGETPIADMRAVTAAIGTELLDEFETRGVRYVRHYHPYVDVPWQQVFMTQERSAVETFCAENGIVHEWLNGDVLRTVQTCQGSARHPLTGERVFFNQAHLFHVSSLGEAGANAMIRLFGRDRLSRQTYFGDGQEIPLEILSRVRAAFAGAALTFAWRAGDVLLLDNMQFAHGRRPFKGPRKVIAALMESNVTAATGSS